MMSLNVIVRNACVGGKRWWKPPLAEIKTIYYRAYSSTPNVEIKLLADKAKEWESMLVPWLEFYEYAPMTRNIQAFKTSSGRESLRCLLKDVTLYDDSPCIIAQDTQTQKVIGCTLSHTFSKSDLEKEGLTPIPYSKYVWDKNCGQNIMELERLKKVQSLAPIFKEFGVDRVLKWQLGVVTQEHIGTGVISKLYEKGMMEMQSRGYDAGIAESTNEMSYGFFQTHGFKLAYEFEHSQSGTDSKVHVGVWVLKLN